jgi:LPS O-antigen subunit length determinant protein (WzzB/FepE family)
VFRWISRVNLLAAFAVLLAFHLLLYYFIGTEKWVSTALLASIVETGMLALTQIAVGGREEDRAR